MLGSLKFFSLEQSLKFTKKFQHNVPLPNQKLSTCTTRESVVCDVMYYT